MKAKSVLPWFGSDASVAPRLGAKLDDCKHVTIPFAGGMSILPHLKAKGVVANDLHSHASNFYRVVSGWYGSEMASEVIQRCNATLSHPDNLELASEQLKIHGIGHVESAWSFWAQCWIGRKGKGGTKNQGGKPSVRRTANGGNNATRIKSAAGDLEAWAEEFRRCEFTCEDFRDVVSKVADESDCGVYCDPPWVGAGEAYLHGFTEADHRDLHECLSWIRNAKVLVRYGDDPLIRDLYRGWNIEEATSRTQANKPLGELWITNI